MIVKTQLGSITGAPPDAPIPCDLLTGYLGSGKTTLLNAFLRSPESRATAVIVNEIGTVGLDQILLQEVSDNVFLLESGCLCCTMGGSLRDTLLDLRQRSESLAGNDAPGLKRIIIETTGLADPRPILHQFLGDKTLNGLFRLNQIVATVDAVHGQRQFREQREPVVQAALAERIVLTKTDLVDAVQTQALIQSLGLLNPMADVVESSAGSAAVKVFSQVAHDVADPSPGNPFRRIDAPGFATARRPAPTLGAVHRSDVRAISLFLDQPTTWAGVSAWWSLLVHRYGDRLLRVKGLLRLDERLPIVFIQGVGTHFHSPRYLSRWPDDDPRSRLVCIGSGLDETWLRESLSAFSVREPGVRPTSLSELGAILQPEMATDVG